MQTINIGKNIEEMRNFRNISKESLAKKCDVDIDIISKWENGDIIPRAEELLLIAKSLKTTVDYFYVDLEERKEYAGFSNDADALLSVALATMSTAKFSNPLQRVLLQRTSIEELVNLKLLTLNTPQYSIAHTTEKQRRDAISCFEDIIGEEYEDILQGYVNGKNEIGKLGEEILARADKHRLKEQEEKDKKRKNPIWDVYITVVLSFETSSKTDKISYTSFSPIFLSDTIFFNGK